MSRKGADRFRSGHPWIFESDVADKGAAQGGDTVRVVDHRDQFLGQGHYSAASQIALRMLSRSAGPIDIPAGRFAVMADPVGAAFGVIALAAT